MSNEYDTDDILRAHERAVVAAFARQVDREIMDMAPAPTQTERVAPCTCGSVPWVRGGQDPESLTWSFYVSCGDCGNCERGAHGTVAQAVAAWNYCATSQEDSPE